MAAQIIRFWKFYENSLEVQPLLTNMANTAVRGPRLATGRARTLFTGAAGCSAGCTAAACISHSQTACSCPLQVLFALGDTIGQVSSKKKGERWDWARESSHAPAAPLPNKPARSQSQPPPPHLSSHASRRSSRQGWPAEPSTAASSTASRRTSTTRS